MKTRFLSVPPLAATIGRFPLAFASGVAAFLTLMNIRYGLFAGFERDQDLGRIASIMIVGIFLHAAFALAPAETRRRKALWAAAGAALHLAYGLSVWGLPNSAALWPFMSGCGIGMLLSN